MASAGTVNILSLPLEILEAILAYCSYDEISGTRLVCKQFNDVCKQLLNQGFSYVDRLHAAVQKDVKSKLPRRESERRNHPLAKHVNVLSSVETRLSLLSMTFVKYIDLNLCCFIPGKVLDELLRVLRAVSKPDLQPRAHELLQELRDISSMAMEHFEEAIVPLLKTRMPAAPSSPFGPMPGAYHIAALQDAAAALSIPTAQAKMPVLKRGTSADDSTSSPPAPVSPLCVRGSPVRHELRTMRASLHGHGTALAALRRDLSAWRTRAEAERAGGVEQARRVAELGRGLADAQKQGHAAELRLSELTRPVDGQDERIAALMAEMAELRRERGGGVGGSADGGRDARRRLEGGRDARRQGVEGPMEEEGEAQLKRGRRDNGGGDGRRIVDGPMEEDGSGDAKKRDREDSVKKEVVVDNLPEGASCSSPAEGPLHITGGSRKRKLPSHVPSSKRSKPID